MKRRVQIYVSGLVQGVFFRASTKERANQLGLSGFVRNLPDRRVEIVAEGPDSAVDSLIQWCESGPPGANVQSVDVNEERFANEFDAFTVRSFR